MATESQLILTRLRQVLEHLQSDPYPHVPQPEGCKRRASVAVILRVRPAFQPVAQTDASVVTIDQPETPSASLADFFSQEWVQNGDPEILFIKRAGRAGDRWSGHVALPGGKRDPEDESDVAAAIRETREEVGLDLSSSNCLQAGNLPERVVATTWGREALMVLCPYLFVMTSKHTAVVQPQPTEVAAAHWIPLRALLSPNLRTKEYVDTASRMAKQGGPIAQTLLRAMVGRMSFSAIRLVPSESVYATSIPGFIPSKAESEFTDLAHGAFGIPSSTQGLGYQQSLLLWGLTLGVLADFLDMLPPYNAISLWKYPTFTPPDLRFIVYLFTRDLRKNNAGDLSAGTWPYKRRPSQTAMDATTQAIAVTEAEPSKMVEHARTHQNEVGIGGLGVGTNREHAVGRLLTGYYSRVNVAIGFFLAYRLVLGAFAVRGLYGLWRRRRASL